MTGRNSLPLRVLVTAATDTPIGLLAHQIEDERLIVTACATEDEAHRSLAAGLPDCGILDGSLPGASLLRVYSALRPERAHDYLPVLITSHAMDAAATVAGIPDIYLSPEADIDAVRNALYQSLGLPLPETSVARPDPLVASLLTGLRDGGFDAATYGSASSVLKELKDGLPAAAVLDARLPEQELMAVYRSIREQPGGADLPVLFIHDLKCPPGAIVRDGADMYLGEGASIDDALESLQQSVFPNRGIDRAREEPEAAPIVAPRRGFRWPITSTGASNSLAAKVLRALPIAAMIVIGGFAGVMTVRTVDTRSWPLAHPIEVSAATPPATPPNSALAPTESPLQALATRAAQSSPSSRVTRVTPEPANCSLMPAFEMLREQVGVDEIGICTDQPTVRENGDAQQPTTKGLFALKSRDNWVAFTDGHRTWVKGPNGVQQRLNAERFPWESTSATFDVPSLAFADATAVMID
ncbi:MAG: hypothetical protein ACKVVP_13370 [Chloroflexota bacterium]